MRIAIIMLLVCLLVPAAHAGSGCHGTGCTVQAAPVATVQLQLGWRFRGLRLCERIRNNRAQRRFNRSVTVAESTAIPVQSVQMVAPVMLAPCVNGQCNRQ